MSSSLSIFHHSSIKCIYMRQINSFCTRTWPINWVLGLMQQFTYNMQVECIKSVPENWHLRFNTPGLEFLKDIPLLLLKYIIDESNLHYSSILVLHIPYLNFFSAFNFILLCLCSSWTLLPCSNFSLGIYYRTKLVHKKRTFTFTPLADAFGQSDFYSLTTRNSLPGATHPKYVWARVLKFEPCDHVLATKR